MMQENTLGPGLNMPAADESQTGQHQHKHPAVIQQSSQHDAKVSTAEKPCQGHQNPENRHITALLTL